MTQAMLSRMLAAVLAAGLLAVPLRAEEAKAPQGETKASQPYVVMVGISNYADKQIKPRPHAEDDAKAVYEVLTDKKYLGADAQHSRLLLGDSAKVPGSEPATRANILKELRWLADNAKSNDLVVFGFFGEGGPLGDHGDRRCYFASDSTFQGRDKDAVAASEIGDALKKLKSQRFCVLLDVNFKGFTTTDKKVAEPTLGSPPYKEFLGDDGTEDHGAKSGHALFLATNGLQPSLDLKDHGVFAAALLKAFRGAADKDGYEPDGVVTVDELTEYLQKEIGELVRTNGKTREQKEQFFWAIGGPRIHYILTTNPDVIAKAQERLDKFTQLVKDRKVPQQYAEEGKNLLERMPRLEAQRKLRKQYQALADGKIDVDKFVSERTTILEGMKLSRAEAKDFADSVMKAISILTRSYVKELNRNDLVAWAIRGLYRGIDEKVPEKIETRLKNIRDLKDMDDLTKLLADARQELGKREDLDNHKDIDHTLQLMMKNHLDPYTTFIDAEQVKRMRQEIEGRFPGVGIQIRKDSATDQLLVVTPIKGSPAYKAGIMAGDLITTVTRPVDSQGKPLEPPEVIPTKGLKLSDAVSKIIGQPGTKVKLTIQREGADKPIDFEMTRNYVEVESVLGFQRKKDDNWDYMIDPANKIGYIRLTSFAANSYRDLRNVMRALEKRGIQGFVLDLRFNPGGRLDSAIEISDLFIDDGVIVSVRPRNGREEKVNGEAGGMLDFPMVCLVNGGSASGSEIVSAALQDNKRAYIIGERSYGKGSVQTIRPFDGGELKLTTASFWRPSGKNLNKSSTSGKEDEDWGVIPDKVIKLTPKEHDDLYEYQRNTEIIQRKDKPAAKTDFKDKQLDAALEYLRGQIKTAGRSLSKKAG